MTVLISKRLIDPLYMLAEAYFLHFGKPLKVTSGWRSYSDQKNIVDKECIQQFTCAQAGHSEHQSGLAIDFSLRRDNSYTWMRQHAHLFGFHQSYQK